MSLPVLLSNPALLLEDSNKSSSDGETCVVVHPLAVLHVLDHHSRRQEGRVIGTLLGRRDGNRVIVTNCFAVPHAERGDEVAIGKDFNKKMLALHMRTNKEAVVGWYASAAGDLLIADTSSLIHEFYAGECDDGNPIHLVVDTRLQDSALQMKAYQSAQVVLQGEHVGNVFHELQLTLHSNEPETICLNAMIHGTETSKKAEHDHTNGTLQVSMEKLYELLEVTLKYVDAVVEGKVEADAEKGRQIADTLATVPRVRPEIFDKLFHDSLQDLLMVTYLSNLTRTQLEIAEKLNATLGSA